MSLKQNKYQETEDYYREALELHRKIKSTHGIANDYEKLGNLMKEQERYEEAISYFIKELRIADSLQAISIKERIEKEFTEIKETVGEEQFNQWMKEYKGMSDDG